MRRCILHLLIVRRGTITLSLVCLACRCRDIFGCSRFAATPSGKVLSIMQLYKSHVTYLLVVAAVDPPRGAAFVVVLFLVAFEAAGVALDLKT